jgi:hypothetical protein
LYVLPELHCGSWSIGQLVTDELVTGQQVN